MNFEERALEEILKRIDGASELTLNTIEEVMGIAGRYVVFRGVMFLVIALILLSILLFSIYKTRQFKRKEAKLKDSDNIEEYHNVKGIREVMEGVVLVMGAINLVGTTTLIYEGLIRLALTEWKTLELILELIN